MTDIIITIVISALTTILYYAVERRFRRRDKAVPSGDLKIRKIRCPACGAAVSMFGSIYSCSSLSCCWIGTKNDVIIEPTPPPKGKEPWQMPNSRN